MLRACRQSKAPAIETIVTLAVETAMRRGEIIGMQWRYVDLNKQTVLLEDTKNGDFRTVPSPGCQNGAFDAVQSQAVLESQPILRPTKTTVWISSGIMQLA